MEEQEENVGEEGEEARNFWRKEREGLAFFNLKDMAF